MLGEIAEGGGDFTVVSVSPFVVTLLLDVDSVTMGSAIANDDAIMKPTTRVVSLRIILSPFWVRVDSVALLFIQKKF